MSKRRGAASADLPWGSENINQRVQQHWYQLPWPNKKTYDLGYWALGVPLLILVALAESQRRRGANGACCVEVERTVFTHSFIYLFVRSLCGGDSELSMNSVLPSVVTELSSGIWLPIYPTFISFSSHVECEKWCVPLDTWICVSRLFYPFLLAGTHQHSLDMQRRTTPKIFEWQWVEQGHPLTWNAHQYFLGEQQTIF